MNLNSGADPGQKNWPPPLLPGQWKTLALNDSCALLARLAVIENELNMEPTAVLANYRRVRATNFPDVPNWLLIEAEAVLPDEKIGYRAFFYGPGVTLIPVHWVSHPFQPLFQGTPAEARSAGFLRAYLKIFSNLLAGEAGRFIIVESPEELALWHDGKADIPSGDLGRIAPIEIEATGSGTKARAFLLYGGQVARVEFLIDDSGMVSMEGDETLFSVGTRHEDFRGPFRLVAVP